MFCWKTTQNILNLKNDGEVFDQNWMNYNSVQMPPSTIWLEKRPLKVEEVDIWEVVSESSGPVGVYAAWCPYDELYVVTKNWRIVAEFSGVNANERLEQYLIKNKIHYPKSKTI